MRIKLTIIDRQETGCFAEELGKGGKMLNVLIIHVDIPCSLTAFEDMIGWYKHDVCREAPVLVR